MRCILLYVLLFVFTVGSLAPAALAFECDMLNTPAQSEAMNNMNGDMPCHDTSNSADHCDGICMCLSLSLSQNQIFEDTSLFKQRAIVAERYAFFHGAIQSTSPLPLYKPPIMLS